MLDQMGQDMGFNRCVHIREQLQVVLGPVVSFLVPVPGREKDPQTRSATFTFLQPSETMGIKGMKTLVENSNILEDVSFKDSSVIIDGPSLYYSLYFKSKPKLDQQHGGDYSAFRELVHSFFTSLERCNITPLVVLDGGAEPVKGNTVGDRLKDKLQKAKRISESKAGEWDNILPPLVKDVFIQILQELHVEVQQCFGEADLIAALTANERKCPVLSNDSDFYVFDVQEGYLPIDGFQWEHETQGAIPARHYKISQFCRHFNVDRNHMPIFAALSGNDYSQLEKEDSKKLTRRYLEAQEPGSSSPGQQRVILWFLGGFRGRTTEEAVRAALQLVGRSKEEEIKHFLDSSQQYALMEPPRPNLPEWVIHQVHRGKLTSFVTSIVIQKSMMLTPLVEDFSQPSSYNASLRIRQFFYGLLVGTERCREYDREGAEAVRPKEVAPVLPGVKPEDLKKLELNHLNEAPEDLRRTVLSEALRCSNSDIEHLTDQLKLPLCVTRFWFQYRQQNHPGSLNRSCLQALVLGFVYGEADAGEMDGLKPGRHPLQPGAAHAFSQWQNCMRQSLHLNQLLSFPLQEPQCSRLYCGPLLHNLQDELQRNTSAFTEMKNLLDEGRRVLLETLLRIIDTQSAAEGPQVMMKDGKRRSLMVNSQSGEWSGVSGDMGILWGLQFSSDRQQREDRLLLCSVRRKNSADQLGDASLPTDPAGCVVDPPTTLPLPQVTVLYFARSAELTGLKEQELVAVPTPISSGDLWALLLRKQPRLVALQGHVVLAVRQQYVAIGDQQVTLADGDEVAVVPPLSGG
ncbi:single-strand DNA endonuclease ASTE1-like [Anableps anableps]